MYAESEPGCDSSAWPRGCVASVWRALQLAVGGCFARQRGHDDEEAPEHPAAAAPAVAASEAADAGAAPDNDGEVVVVVAAAETDETEEVSAQTATMGSAASSNVREELTVRCEKCIPV